MKRITQIWMLLLSQVPVAVCGQARQAQAVLPEPVLEIGEVLGESDVYAFTDIAAVVVVGDSILVLESASNEIRIFDHDGAFLGRVGRNGEGPGEFLWATALRLVPEGMVVVDLKARRQSYFSLKGDLLRTEPLGRLSNQPLAGSASMRGGEWIAETAVTINSEGGTFPERLLVLMRPGSSSVDTIARYSTGYVPYRAPGSFGFLGRSAGSEGDWAIAGDSLLAVVAGEPPVLRWWRSGVRTLSSEGQIALPIRDEAFTR